MSTFAERLTELRERTNKKRQEVADDLNISRASLEFYEKGKRKPDIDVLLKIAKYYNVSTDYLVGLSSAPTNNITVSAICDYTGLNKEAIYCLHEYADLCNHPLSICGLLYENINVCEVLSYFITNEYIGKIMSYTDLYIGELKELRNTYEKLLFVLKDHPQNASELIFNLSKKAKDSENLMFVSKFKLQEVNKEFLREYTKNLEETLNQLSATLEKEGDKFRINTDEFEFKPNDSAITSKKLSNYTDNKKEGDPDVNNPQT